MDEAEVEVDAANDDERGSGGAKILKFRLLSLF